MGLARLLTPGRISIPCYLASAPAAFAVCGEGAGLYASAGGESLEVVSTDNTKDIPVGTGARQVSLLIMKDNGTVAVVSTPTSGTSPAVIAAVSDAAFILDAWVSMFGSDDTNAGTLTVRKQSAGGDRVKIPVGRKRAMPGQYKVPNGYRFVLEGLYLGFNNTAATAPLTCEAEIEAQVSPSDGSVATHFTRIGAPAIGTFNRAAVGEFKGAEPVPAGSIIRMRAYATNTSILAGSFWGQLIADPDTTA